jgi:hypothetical protein
MTTPARCLLRELGGALDMLRVLGVQGPAVNDLAKAIRSVAERLGSLEAVRRRAKLSNDAFYPLTQGKPAKTTRTLRKLRKAGVKHPLVDAA